MINRLRIPISLLGCLLVVILITCFASNHWQCKARETDSNDCLYIPRTKRVGEPYIVINTHLNRLVLRTDDSVLLSGDCSTGSGKILVDSASGKVWNFVTPKGAFAVSSKLKNPWWRKPDWAFIEEGEPLPRRDEDRLDDEMLGAYAIGFGDGYYVHGTVYEGLLGIGVTHGCVRLGAEDLEAIYEKINIGTPIYIF